MSVSFALLAVVTAFASGLPLRDPDGLLGPSYVRLPLIVVVMIVLDVAPRVVLRRPVPQNLYQTTMTVFHQRWPGSKLMFVMAGLACFYLAYVAYRNMKSFLPFLRERVVDRTLLAMDEVVAGGYHPGDILQELLGTGISAEVLSTIYMSYLVFVPLSVAAALVWSSNLSHGAWYVSALSLNWIIGTATYYVLPSLGPVYLAPSHFVDLPDTAVSQLQDALYRNRVTVLADPHATQSVHGIAAFASLHVSVVFTAALIAHLLRLPKPVRWILWGYLALTALATVYFGWHYLLDVPAGLAVGGLSTWLAARATTYARTQRSATANPITTTTVTGH
ncbi:membrane-associated phospholipid phosphatase [Arthrobacter sp. CAN_A6]|uniref:phosphatase PAP2 family protein n=1 Tax=Arthrobacter sp. CAN_A6 TaxID=2787721 RepID=UPI0018CA9F8F